MPLIHCAHCGHDSFKLPSDEVNSDNRTLVICANCGARTTFINGLIVKVEKAPTQNLVLRAVPEEQRIVGRRWFRVVPNEDDRDS